MLLSIHWQTACMRVVNPALLREIDECGSIDPANLAASTPQPEVKSPSGGGAKGAAGGAAAGAAIGAVAGDAGQGAAIGATAGAIHGRRQQKKAKKQAQQQAQQQQQTAQQQNLDTFKRAMSACLDSRGYSVK